MKKKGNYVLLFVVIMLLFTISWVKKAYGQVPLDQIFYHLKAPVEGTTAEIIPTIILECILKPFIVFGFLLLIIYLINKFVENKFNFQGKVWTYLGIGLIIFEVIYTLNYYDVLLFFKNSYTNSNFIEDNYIDPKDVSITFPDKKKNLIYIYVESLESTYASKNVGGSFENNLIPELTNLAKNNANFSPNGDFGGLYSLTDTNWTIAGIVSQTAGIPLKVSTDGHAYKSEDEFLKEITTLGDILEEQGYKQMFLLGSDATFGGRRSYFKAHGNYEFMDYIKAKEKEYIAHDYYNFWGYEDSKLFEFAKKELSDLSEPFNLTMLTVNTHTPGGYLEENCEKKYKNQIENVINCTDRQLVEFIDWVKEQSFYDNTTIIIVGDHVNMDSSFIKTKERYTYNVIINGLDEYNRKREASSFDMFPTTLAALNVEISGNRLGLGTNLYSDEETIIEKYGFKYVEDEIKKKSTFYDKNFLFE